MKTKAEELRAASGTASDSVARQVMREAERLNDHVKSLYWYAVIPYTDRKELKKQGFTLTDGDGHVHITW